MYGTPVGATPMADDIAYHQGKQDQCLRLACYIGTSILLLMFLIWFISWLFRPSYYAPYPHGAIVRRYVVHQASGGLFS